jgi:hypothetical protein
VSRIAWITIGVLALICVLGTSILIRGVSTVRVPPLPEQREASHEQIAPAAAPLEGVVARRAGVAIELVHIRGRVILPPGTPGDEEVRVGALGGNDQSNGTEGVSSPVDEAGAFDLQVPRTWGWTELLAAGRYVFVDSPSAVSLEGEVAFQELHPLLGARIEGTLFGMDELNVSTADGSEFGIELRTPWVDGSHCIGHLARIDPPSAFVIDAICADCKYELEIDLPGFAQQALPIEPLVPGRTTRVVVPLARVATVRGTIVTRAGAPLAMAKIRPFGGRQSFTRRHDGGLAIAEDGTFTLSGLPPGTDRLIVSHTDHPGRVFAIAPLSAGEVREGIRIVLDDFARLGGIVVDESGRGIPFSHVVITDRDRSETPLWDWNQQTEVGADWQTFLARSPEELWHNSIMGVTTDESGRFDCDRLVCGRVLVTAWHDNRLNRTPIPIVLEAEKKSDVRLELHNGTYLYVLLVGDPSPTRPAASIRVLDREGIDHANRAFPIPAALRLRQKAGLIGVPVGPLLRGDYRVIAVGKDGTSVEETVSLVSAEPLQVTLTLGGAGK